jgi:PAS domain S-box-containing protein
MPSNASSDPMTRVDDVLITAELASRPARPANYKAESEALGLLAQEMATNPRGVLQKCAELVMELCHADSAGISILDPGGTGGTFRWHAAAGAFAPNLHGTMPREASPCGTVVERDQVLLFSEAERFFPALRGVEPRIYENLLAPWQVKGEAVGTLWAIKHRPETRFDAEDARILQSLARFAAAAFQMISALDETTAERSALSASEEQYRAALDTMSEGFALFDADFTILDVNAETLRLDGRTREEIVGRNHWETFPGSENSPQGEMFKRVMRDRLPAAMEHSYQWPDGRILWIDTRAYPTAHGRIGILWRDITERKQAEASLRESEARFRQFAHAAAEGAWIRDAETLTMEYVSPAAVRIYGVEPHMLLDGVQHWASLIVPEDREATLAHLEDARQGDVVTHEFRIRRPSDGAFRWIRSTDFPLLDSGGRVQRIGGLDEDITEAKLAIEHQGVLLAELQHRVRNIMAMIRSTARRSADGAADVPEYRTLLEGRLLALARVQALLTRQANAGGTLRDIVESEVGAQAHGGGQYELVGPDVQLPPKAVEVLTLALHELATNALKYGALSVPEGRLRVEWAPFEKLGRTWLAINWTEDGAPSRGPATRRGFGSDLIEGKIPYELGGSGKISVEPEQAHCRLEFPLKGGESILETDAPSPTTIFGGTLDMSGAPDLTGRSVLVVEDDYYMASDTAAALRGAGATVLGPCPSEDATLDLLETATPTHAVLDLNLGGGGPRFEIAHALKEHGVPFIFLTGYDPDAVPADLADVVRLQKPVSFSRIVEAVAQL